MSAKQIPASDLPFCLPPSYGTITHAEMICPGYTMSPPASMMPGRASPGNIMW